MFERTPPLRGLKLPGLINGNLIRGSLIKGTLIRGALILAFMAVAAPTPSAAETLCLSFDQTQVCNDGSSAMTFGKTTYFDDGRTALQSGKATYYSDLQSSRTVVDRDAKGKNTATVFDDGRSVVSRNGTSYFDNGAAARRFPTEQSFRRKSGMRSQTFGAAGFDGRDCKTYAGHLYDCK